MSFIFVLFFSPPHPHLFFFWGGGRGKGMGHGERRLLLLDSKYSTFVIINLPKCYALRPGDELFHHHASDNGITI